MEFIELASAVRPTSGKPKAVIAAVLTHQFAIGAVAIDLQDTARPSPLPERAIPGPAVLEAIGDRRWAAAIAGTEPSSPCRSVTPSPVNAFPLPACSGSSSG